MSGNSLAAWCNYTNQREIRNTNRSMRMYVHIMYVRVNGMRGPIMIDLLPDALPLVYTTYDAIYFPT